LAPTGPVTQAVTMTGQAFLAYLGVVALITITPGPDTALVVRNSLRMGARGGLRTAAGAAAGLLCWGSVAAAGLTAVLAASSAVFTVVRIAGAAYLVVLGALALLAAIRGQRPPEQPVDDEPSRPRGPFAQGLFGNLLNPKAAAFFTALLPQFVSATGLAAAPWIALATLLAATASFTGLSAFALLAARTRRARRRDLVERIGAAVTGVVLVVLGGRLAFTRR
jgi:threonine/homoserine/homoserine lactone efflux protein